MSYKAIIPTKCFYPLDEEEALFIGDVTFSEAHGGLWIRNSSGKRLYIGLYDRVEFEEPDLVVILKPMGWKLFVLKFLGVITEE